MEPDSPARARLGPGEASVISFSVTLGGKEQVWDSYAQFHRQSLAHFHRRDISAELVMLSEMLVCECRSRKFPGCPVAGNHVQVDVSVLVHQEGIIEMIRLKERGDGLADIGEQGPEFHLFSRRQRSDIRFMPLEHQHGFAQVILVAVNDDVPVRPRSDVISWLDVMGAK